MPRAKPPSPAVFFDDKNRAFWMLQSAGWTGYLLLRVEPLLASTGWASPTTAWIGAITALLLGAVAVGHVERRGLGVDGRQQC